MAQLDETISGAQIGHITDHEKLAMKANHIFDVKDFGAIGDGSTDDTTAIQATVTGAQTAAPVTVGIAGGDIYFPPGQYLISNSIVFDRFVGIIRGAGPGLSPNWHPSQSSNNSVIMWGGNNSTPMFLITDSRDLTIEQLRFHGNATNPPTYAIECLAESGDNKGANIHMIFRNLVIGEYAFTGVYDAGNVDRGIGFTGLNQNNAQFFIERTQIRADDIGLYLPNAQSTWGSLRDVVFDNCATGIETDARLYLSNPGFQTNTLDLNITGSANVVISHINSENAGKFANVSDNGNLAIYGGQIQTGTIISGGGVFIDASPSDSQSMTFEEITLTQMTDASMATIDWGPASGSSDAGRIMLTVKACRDWDPAQLNSTDDFWSQAPESHAVIEWQSYAGNTLHQFRNELRGRTALGVGQRDAIDTTVWDLPHGTAQEGWQVPAFTDAARPNATACVAGTMIWNTDDGFPNWSDGTNWVIADGNTT